MQPSGAARSFKPRMSLPRLLRISPVSRPKLYIDVQHGLCNRLRAMASAAVLARASRRELVVIWRADHHCGCRLSDLFDYPGPVIEDDRADQIRRQSARVYNYMEIEEGAQYLEEITPREIKGDIYIRSAYSLISPQANFEAEQPFLKSLIPARPVQDLVDSVPHPSDLALHIRKATGPGFDHLAHESPDNWPEERHQELIHWRAQSQPERFIQRLDQLMDAGAESFFLAADHPDTYAQFSERYGARMRHLPRGLYDRSARQLQYALADLLLLTFADKLLASTWSSFSDMAQRLAPYGRALEKSGKDF